jgi:hypothetical protein
MHIIGDVFWIQKSGSLATEYEDAFWPLPTLDTAVKGQMSVAVADGATESSYSSIWARQLARAYVRDEWFLADALGPSLKKKQTHWSRIVNRKPKPWYAEQKLEQGAFAALAGLTFFEGTESGRWTLLVSGDCCMTQIRDDGVLRCDPFSRSADFDNGPVLMATNPQRNEDALSQLVRREGDWMSGDVFYLMTDALATCYFRDIEAGGLPWQVFRDFGTDEGPVFENFVSEARKQKRMRNDDVTLYRISVL